MDKVTIANRARLVTADAINEMDLGQPKVRGMHNNEMDMNGNVSVNYKRNAAFGRDGPCGQIQNITGRT